MISLLNYLDNLPLVHDDMRDANRAQYLSAECGLRLSDEVHLPIGCWHRLQFKGNTYENKCEHVDKHLYVFIDTLEHSQKRSVR